MRGLPVPSGFRENNSISTERRTHHHNLRSWSKTNGRTVGSFHFPLLAEIASFSSSIVFTSCSACSTHMSLARKRGAGAGVCIMSVNCARYVERIWVLDEIPPRPAFARDGFSFGITCLTLSTERSVFLANLKWSTISGIVELDLKIVHPGQNLVQLAVILPSSGRKGAHGVVIGRT